MTSDLSSILDFQPMPKRFMVWNELTDRWLRPFDSEQTEGPYIFGFYELLDRLRSAKCCLKEGAYKVVQSTNLFDKDGEEIFEGSVIEGHWVFHNGIGEIEHNILGVVKQVSGCWCIVDKTMGKDEGKMIWEVGQEELKLIGHIFSNPELLEEK